MEAVEQANEFNHDVLLPLTELGIQIPTGSELMVAKSYVERQRENAEFKNYSIINSTLKILHSVKDAFVTTYQLFEAIETLGCSTSTNESSFSALNQISKL